jgi:hypothetical protein
MNTRFKVFASYNILQYLCDLIHVLIFVIVSKCRKSPKLTNIVIEVQTQFHVLTNQFSNHTRFYQFQLNHELSSLYGQSV